MAAETISADGTIYCLDLSHGEAQTQAVTLAQSYPEVTSVLRSRNGNMYYLLVMTPTKQPTETVAMLARHAMLIEGLSIMYKRSQEFGVFEIVVIPNSQHVLDAWTTVQME